MNVPRHLLIWHALILIIAGPIVLAAFSPLLAWRDPIYIIASFAGIIALAVLVAQPLLAFGLLPGVSPQQGRKMHRVLGAMLVVAVVTHVGGLWITSPPDVVDALTFTSPTPFSIWGVIAMWAVFGTAALATFRKRLTLRRWRAVHGLFALLIVAGTVVHALQIEGAMEPFSKAALCLAAVVAMLWTVWKLRIWTLFKRKG